MRQLKTTFKWWSLALAMVLATACQPGDGDGADSQDQGPSRPSPKEKLAILEENTPPSEDSIWIDGNLFLLTAGMMASGGDYASLHKGYYGTVQDTLFFVSEVDHAEGCMAKYPILCWKDTAPSKPLLYSSAPERACKGRKDDYLCLYSARLVHYYRVEDEGFYVVKHRIESNTDAVEVQVGSDPRWPDRMRRAEKTLIVSTLQGVVGVYTNGVVMDVFPF